MALIIEDGTIVENANSFATVDECRAYAEARGLTLPVDDTEVEVLLVQACDYLFSLENDYQGYRVNEEQELPFPRDPIYVFDKDVSFTIPKILKQAQCRLAFDASNGALLATGAGRVIKKEGVGALSVEYADDGVSNPQQSLTAAMTILDPLFNTSANSAGGGINIPVTR